MGFRFRRSIRILPSVRVNLSRSGISTSIGGRGAHVTLGHGQVRTTVGVPGTGVSYTTTEPLHGATQRQTSQKAPGAAQLDAVPDAPGGARSVTALGVLLILVMFVLAAALLGIIGWMVLR